MQKRKIIKIDETKCNGCGECIPNCREGALQIIDGKARLISDIFCDGLGACLGHCPQGAITIEEREAGDFDENKVKQHLAAKQAPLACGCPGSKVMDFRRKKEEPLKGSNVSSASCLRQWPVQILLVPPSASYLNHAHLLIAADCVPFACADFHEKLLKGKILLVGCPKLDDINIYKEKFAQILKNNQINSITYAHMEVPCCYGLVGIIKSVIAESAKDVPFKEIIVSIKGEIQNV